MNHKGTDIPAPERPRTLTDLIHLVLDAADSPNTHTQRAYRRALNEFFRWYGDVMPGPLTKATVDQYLEYLRDEKKSPATINQTLSVLRKLADQAKSAGLLDSETTADIVGIRGKKRRPQRTDQSLTDEDAVKLIAAPDVTTASGQKDRVMLGLLLECALSREEAATLEVSQFQKRGNGYVLADLTGKHGRLRTVRVPTACARHIERWIATAELTDGRLLRPVNKGDRVCGDRVSDTAIYKRLVLYSKHLGLGVTPHDLRRTFAQLSAERGANIRKISQALGHASLRTTELYLGLNEAPCDKLDLDDD
jgi:integrase